MPIYNLIFFISNAHHCVRLETTMQRERENHIYIYHVNEPLQIIKKIQIGTVPFVIIPVMDVL